MSFLSLWDVAQADGAIVKVLGYKLGAELNASKGVFGSSSEGQSS